MKSEQASVSKITPLVNGFSEVIIHAPHHAHAAKPGHFVLLADKYLYYVLSQQSETISVIVRDAELDLQHSRSISLSPLLGSSLAPPSLDDFTLIQACDGALSAVIFYLKKYKRDFDGLILLGAEQFPFKPCPSRLLIKGMPNEVIGALPLFEDWHIPHRLASTIEQPGCFHGTLDELANVWLHSANIAKPLKTLYIAAPKIPATIE